MAKDNALPPKKAGVRVRVATATKPSNESDYTRKGKRERKGNKGRLAERIEKRTTKGKGRKRQRGRGGQDK